MQIRDAAQNDEYYRALLERDPAYLGIFYLGVTSTSVCCISTCRARKPKRENVLFFSELKSALDHGFRPCKICRPTENAHAAPPSIEKAIALVRDHPKEKISDARLRDLDISPEAVRRWFKQHYGMTFHAFQRSYRINQAMLELKGGHSTTQTAFENGYESLSGFAYTYKKLLGKSPRTAPDAPVIYIHRFDARLGPMFVAATAKGICLLEFVDRRMLETEFRDLQRLLKAPILAGENAHTRKAQTQIQEYFAGKRKVFELDLDAPGTEFQRLVWEGLQNIPYGSTRSYQAQAQFIGKPQAVRAVGTANGCNRIAIVVPCHRVIGKDGQLHGYGGGLARKRWLLDHEQKFV